MKCNMDKSQKQKHAEWKGSYKKQNKTVCTVWFHAYDILEEVKLIWGGKYQNRICPIEGDVAEGIDCNKQEKIFQGNDDFYLHWLSYPGICICQQMQQKNSANVYLPFVYFIVGGFYIKIFIQVFNSS